MTGEVELPSGIRWDAAGLVPAVVQDVADGRVLMLAYMDAEALEATVATGDVHFHSRSRGTLWRKGETSGNVLRLVGLAVDCDRDALLVTARPSGPTCHRGTRSCFDPDGAVPGEEGSGAAGPGQPAAPDVATEPTATMTPDAMQGFAWLETLWDTIARRAAERPDGSYTTSLLAGGVDAVARKVTEEATEVLLAAKDDAVSSTTESRQALAGETADLLYHALVLLAERDMDPAEVMEVLRGRHAG